MACVCTILDFLSELATELIVVDSSFTLTSSSNALVLSSRNERLRANLSKTLYLLQALESELNHALQEASFRGAKFERSLDRSKSWLLKHERNLAKLKAEHAKAFKKLAHRHRVVRSAQVTALRQEALALRKVCF